MTKQRVWSKEEEQWLKDNLRYDQKSGNLYRVHSRKGVSVNKPCGDETKAGYIQLKTKFSRPDGKAGSYKAHKIIWLLVYGEQAELLDHIDGDSKNNKIENLRIATPRANSINRKPWGKCKYKGVSKNNKKFQAAITKDSLQVYLGTFDTPEEAAIAFDKKVEEYKRRYPELSAYYKTNKELGLL